MRGWTYILECSDGTLYSGSTVWLEARLRQHEEGGGSSYTRNRRPVRLIWAEQFDRIDDAFALERRLQKWSRAQKVAFIEGRLLHLPQLSARGAQPSGARVSTAHFPTIPVGERTGTGASSAVCGGSAATGDAKRQAGPRLLTDAPSGRSSAIAAGGGGRCRHGSAPGHAEGRPP